MKSYQNTLIQPEKFVKNIYFSFMFVGVILLIVTIWVTSIACTITAYSFLGVSVLLILSLIVYKFVYDGFTLNKIFSITPILLLVGIFIYVLYLLIKHYDQINSGNVTPFYSQIMNSTTFLVLIQVYIIVKAMQTEEFNKTFSIGLQSTLFMMFIELLNIIMLLLLAVNLSYFVTDG